MRRYRTDDKLASATGSRGSVEMTTGITTGTTSRLERAGGEAKNCFLSNWTMFTNRR